MPLAIERVDVALGVGDGVVVRGIPSRDVLSLPLEGIVLVELELQSDDPVPGRGTADERVAERLDHVGNRRNVSRPRGHRGWPCKYRSTDRAASEPCPIAAAMRG